MKRQFLENLGLEKEVIDKILDENSADIGKAKGELEATVKERDETKATIAERDKQLEQLKKQSKGNEELQKQIEQLQADNKNIKLDAAIEKALTGAKAKNLKAVKALLSDLDKAELSEDGTIKGLEEQIKGLKAADDTRFLFDEEKGKKPQIKGVKPGESGDSKPKGITKEEFSKMGYKERLNLYNTNKEAYDTLAGAKAEE